MLKLVTGVLKKQEDKKEKHHKGFENVWMLDVIIYCDFYK